jgi:transposase
VENAIRPTAIGKKNWLFMGDADAGHRAATFYTLMANCHREGVNAGAYLTDIFQRLPTQTNPTVHRLTPKTWAAEASRHKTVTQAAVLSV